MEARFDQVLSHFLYNVYAYADMHQEAKFGSSDIGGFVVTGHRKLGCVACYRDGRKKNENKKTPFLICVFFSFASENAFIQPCHLQTAARVTSTSAFVLGQLYAIDLTSHANN